jgi:putative addiction module component (TIGR02574 family)
MQLSADAIFDAASKLPDDARLELVSRLMDTLPGPPNLLSLDDPNLVEELDRRAADDSGSIPWSVLKNENADSRS